MHHLRTCIGSLCLVVIIVRIEYDDVADTEVCRVSRLRLVESQYYPAYRLSLIIIIAESLYCHSVVNVSRSLLVFKRVIPYRGEARVLLLLVSHFSQQLFVLQETHEAQEIQAFELCGRMDGCKQCRQLGTDIVFPQSARDILLVQLLRCQGLKDVHPLLGIKYFAPCY